MGVLTDLFIASPEDLESKDLALLPLQENGFPAVQAKNIDPSALSSWEELLTGVRPPEADYEAELSSVFDGGPDSPWVGAVRDQFVEAFAKASDNQLIDVAVAWSKEMRAEDEEVIIVQILKEVRALAIEARASRRKMYLWTCL